MQGLLARSGFAQERAAGSIPPELAPWVPWLLEQMPERDCRKFGDLPVCVWPGRLELDVGDKSGRFTLEVELDADAQVALPGSQEIWPQAVQVDGRDVVVLSGDQGPAVRLGRGAHRVSGEFRWARLPEGLPVAPSTGLVRLTVNGESIPAPKRDADRVWLKRVASAEGEGEALNLEVFRRLEDAVPLRVTTRLVLRVSGRAREAALGQVLLAGTTALSLSSELPVRLDPEQGLFVQLRSG
ncbi:MAG TPA: hypothetical protein VGP93_20700, partial [Polyangiaceae bacterium]|nr:hypothetical protein [Polyangiaceae bacterium]